MTDYMNRLRTHIASVLSVMLLLGLAGVLVSFPDQASALTAPTLADYDESDWTDLASSEVTGSISWQTGDLIVVAASAENGGINGAGAGLKLPTASGLTFATTTSTGYGSNGEAFAAVWTATAGSSGSGAVTSLSYGGGSNMAGIAAYVYRGSDGVGNAASGSTVGTVMSLTRGSDNSAVIFMMGDWTAGNDTAVDPSPAGGTQRVATWISGRATLFLFDWGDQGAAGSTSYGISNFSQPTGNLYAAVVEIKGSAAAASGRIIRLRGGILLRGGVLLR